MINRMERNSAKQALIERKLKSLSSKAFGNFTNKVKSGLYLKNRITMRANRASIDSQLKALNSRMNAGIKGNEGKREKLTMLRNIMNEEGNSPRIALASAAAQESALNLAERAIVHASPEPVNVQPVVVAVASPKPMSLLVPSDEEHVNNMFRVLSSKQAQTDLIGLYSDSQAEFTRNGKLTMEIGMSRERDLLAVLQEHIGSELITDINNSLIEDCLYGTTRISIKHVSDKVGSGSVKAKWTSDNDQAKKYIQGMVALDHTKYTHILLIYIDTKPKGGNKITILFITDRTIMAIVEELKEAAFVSKEGTNNRGVEYSKPMIKKMIQGAAFTVHIDDVSLQHGIDPIARRRALILSRR